MGFSKKKMERFQNGNHGFGLFEVSFCLVFGDKGSAFFLAHFRDFLEKSLPLILAASAFDKVIGSWRSCWLSLSGFGLGTSSIRTVVFGEFQPSCASQVEECVGAFKIKVSGLNKKGLAWGQDGYTEILGKVCRCELFASSGC